jgi:hypothetical protein
LFVEDDERQRLARILAEVHAMVVDTKLPLCSWKQLVPLVEAFDEILHAGPHVTARPRKARRRRSDTA